MRSKSYALARESNVGSMRRGVTPKGVTLTLTVRET